MTEAVLIDGGRTLRAAPVAPTARAPRNWAWLGPDAILRVPRAVPRRADDRGVLEGIVRRAGQLRARSVQGRLHRTEPRRVQVLGQAVGAGGRSGRRRRRPPRVRGRLDPPTEVAALARQRIQRCGRQPRRGPPGVRVHRPARPPRSDDQDPGRARLRPVRHRVPARHDGRVRHGLLVLQHSVDGAHHTAGDRRAEGVVARGVRQPRRHHVHVLATDRPARPRSLAARRIPAAVRQLVQRLRDGGGDDREVD